MFILTLAETARFLLECHEPVTVQADKATEPGMDIISRVFFVLFVITPGSIV
jgi:hypothetical protein